MAQDSRSLVDRMNRLIALAHDAVDNYRVALRHVEEAHLRERLTELRDAHARHLRELSKAALRLGITPPRPAQVNSVTPNGPSAVLAPMGAASALRGLLGEERLGCSCYLEALEEAWPDEVRALLESHLAEKRGHLTAIEEAIRDRPWGQAPLQLA